MNILHVPIFMYSILLFLLGLRLLVYICERREAFVACATATRQVNCASIPFNNAPSSRAFLTRVRSASYSAALFVFPLAGSRLGTAFYC